ncbi:hypothetical protein Pelo_17986 [Pelomyxa schiedti]|nr:hypothetical protein Pelo_17986 [Pelomyxa schiedti]
MNGIGQYHTVVGTSEPWLAGQVRELIWTEITVHMPSKDQTWAKCEDLSHAGFVPICIPYRKIVVVSISSRTLSHIIPKEPVVVFSTIFPTMASNLAGKSQRKSVVEVDTAQHSVGHLCSSEIVPSGVHGLSLCLSLTFLDQ